MTRAERRFGRAALLAAGTLVLAGPALAQSAAPSIEGRWCFQTEEYYSFEQCSMRGEINLTRTGEGAYRCTLLTEETCDVVPELITSEQVCTAERDGAALEVQSTVIRFTPEGASYYPDYFSLAVRSAGEMSGRMFSPGYPKRDGEPAAVFTRCGDLVS